MTAGASFRYAGEAKYWETVNEVIALTELMTRFGTVTALKRWRRPLRGSFAINYHSWAAKTRLRKAGKSQEECCVLSVFL